MSGQWAVSDGFSVSRLAVWGWILQVIMLTVGCVSWIFFYRARNRFPVNVRFYPMSLAAFAIAFQIFWAGLLALPSIPCAATTIVIFFTSQICQLSYAYRVLDLLFKLNITKSLILDESDGDEAISTNWYLLHRHLASRPFRYKFITCYCVLCVLVSAACFVADPAFRRSQWCTSAPTLQKANAILLIIWFAFFVCVACLIRSESNDALNLKRELKFTFIMGLIGCIPSLIISIVTGEAFEYTGFARAPLFIVTCCIGIIYPIYLANQHEKLLLADREKGSYAPSIRTEVLTKLLASTDFPEFVAFLKTEFSAENAMFLKAHQKVRENPTEEDFTRLASKYVFPNAVNEINIPYEIRLPIIRLLSTKGSQNSRRSMSKTEPKPGPEVLMQRLVNAFDAARDEVFRAVVRDSLPRFLATPEGNRIRERLLLAKLPTSTTTSTPRDHRDSLGSSWRGKKLGDGSSGKHGRLLRETEMASSTATPMSSTNSSSPFAFASESPTPKSSNLNADDSSVGPGSSSSASSSSSEDVSYTPRESGNQLPEVVILSIE